MEAFYDFAMAAVMVWSAYMGWKHADEPFFDMTRPKMSRRLKIRAFLLVVIGAIIMLAVLLDPAVSKAREVYESMSTVGFKIFWLILMGGLVIVYGVWQLVLYDMVANYRTKYRKHKTRKG